MGVDARGVDLPDELVKYLGHRWQEQGEAVQRALDAMTERERRLAREAAVCGYVRGYMAGRAGDEAIPKNMVVLLDVVDVCLSLPELYPVIDQLSREG